MQKIFDKDGEPISSILNFTNPTFTNPFIIVDKLRDKELPPVIKSYYTIDILKDIDFVIYSKNLTKKFVWIKRQKFAVYIKPSELPAEPGFKKLNQLPPNHYIEIDSANKRVRIVGAYSSPSGSGAWINY